MTRLLDTNHAIAYLNADSRLLLTVRTNDEHFQHVQGIAVENWLV